MVTEVSAVEFSRNPGELLNQVEDRNGSVLIHKDGKPVAALVDMHMFARMQAQRDRFDQLSAQVAAAFEGIPEKEGLAMIDAAVEAERHGSF